MTNKVTATVLSITPFNHDVYKVLLQLPEAVSFQAGQYLEIDVKGQGKPFSIASIANELNQLELHIQDIEDNEWTHEIIRRANQVGELTLTMPHGSCFIRESERPIVLIAGGTGFAQMKSFIEHCKKEWPQRRVHLFWGCKQTEDFYYDLNQLNTDGKAFKVTLVNEKPDAEWEGEIGYVVDTVIKFLGDLTRYDYYVAGSYQMVMATDEALFEAGADRQQIYSDLL